MTALFDKKFEETGFENYHCHTHIGSLLDGYQSPSEMTSRLKEINQKFMCITDHGLMSALPNQLKECQENDLNAVFGIEFYYSPFQIPCNSKEQLDKFLKDLSPEETKKWRKSYHILALAYNETGYTNLIRNSSWGFEYGWGGVPRRNRLNTEQLLNNKDGLIVTSGCYLSPTGQAFEHGGEEEAFKQIEFFYNEFKENFYLEMMLLNFKKQKPYNAFIVKVHQKYGIPLTISGDCHFARKEDSKFQRYMLMVRTGNTIADIEDALKNDPDSSDKFFELQDTELFLKSEKELNLKWAENYSDVIPYELFCQAKVNTVELVNRCKGVKIDRSLKLPEIPNAEEKLQEEIKKGWKRLGLHGKEYEMRIREELEILKKKGFCGYFLLIQQMLDDARKKAPDLAYWATSDNAIAPGRGSVCSSLIGYVLNIHQIDPILHQLLFSRFISDARGGKQIKIKFSKI